MLTQSGAQTRPGVWAVPMPLPGHPILYSIAYLVDSGSSGLMLVDAGYASKSCWRALETALTGMGAVAGVAIRIAQRSKVRGQTPHFLGGLTPPAETVE